MLSLTDPQSHGMGILGKGAETPGGNWRLFGWLPAMNAISRWHEGQDGLIKPGAREEGVGVFDGWTGWTGFDWGCEHFAVCGVELRRVGMVSAGHVFKSGCGWEQRAGLNPATTWRFSCAAGLWIGNAPPGYCGQRSCSGGLLLSMPLAAAVGANNYSPLQWRAA